MNRRHFLIGSAAAACGCGRPLPPATPDAPAAPRGPALADQAAERERHLATLGNFRVPATATRTTPAPAVAVPDVFPQLKARSKPAVRLHPRFGDEPKPHEAKLGGSFAWPAGEAAPAGFAPVLQLTADVVPPGVGFKPGADLLQLFWTPNAAEVRAFWRKRSECTGPPLAPLPVTLFPAGSLPVPCRLFPETVTEFPPPGLMPKQMRAELEKWPAPEGTDPGVRYFADRLAAAPGTKVGGWPRWDADPKTPTCPTCHRMTDYFLTVDSAEWDARTQPRWQPTEERPAPDADGTRTAAGLSVGRVLVFVCKTCAAWPAFAVRSA